MSLPRLRHVFNRTCAAWAVMGLLAWSPCIHGVGNAYLTGTGTFAPRYPSCPPAYALGGYCIGHHLIQHDIGPSWEDCAAAYRAGRITDQDPAHYC
jgi:hypothetical protein